MAGNKIPSRLVNFNVYNENERLLGIATVDLPEFEKMTDTLTGAGVAGEVDVPILGHFGAMETTFKWNVPTKEALALSSQTKAHAVTVRGSIQQYDAATGVYTTYPLAVSMRITPKSISLGSLEVGSAMDTEKTFEVLYVKVLLDRKNVLEIDKLNFICKINGVDELASVRKDMGMN